jgi:hypothetical protein
MISPSLTFSRPVRVSYGRGHAALNFAYKWNVKHLMIWWVSRDNLGENGGGDQNGKRRPVAAL